MQTAETILRVIRERGRRGLPLREVKRLESRMPANGHVQFGGGSGEKGC